MSGGGGTTTVQQSGPPEYLKPYLTDILSQAQQQYYGYNPQPVQQQPIQTGLLNQQQSPTGLAFVQKTGKAGGHGGSSALQQPQQQNQSPQTPNQSAWPQYFPGSTVAGFSPASQMAQNLITQRALQGSPVNQAATQQAYNTLSGNYLYGNPGFNAAYQAAANQIIPQVGSAFGNANRTHSGLAQAALSQGLGNAFAGLYGQERNNQLQALGMAPSIANQGYYDYGQLANVGAQQDVMNQNQLSDVVNRFNYNQNLPYQQLQRYAGFTGMIPSGGGTSTTTAPSAGLAQRLLGGGLAGAGLGQMLGYSGFSALSPWALGGAALGLL